MGVEVTTTATAERLFPTRPAEDCRSNNSTVSALEVSAATYNIQELVNDLACFGLFNTTTDKRIAITYSRCLSFSVVSPEVPRPEI